jgi:hypothetical protein
MAGSVMPPRRMAAILLLAACAIAASAALGGAAGASTASAPSKHVTGTAIGASGTGALPRGTHVRSSFSGFRAFANRSTGFAITELRQGTYPVSTADGGRTWRTAGPALHLSAAQAPLVVDQAGVAGARTWFAWCAACNTVIDATSDSGAHWWRTFMPGNVLSVAGAHNHLTAIVQDAGVWTYRSSDGRRWTRS